MLVHHFFDIKTKEHIALRVGRGLTRNPRNPQNFIHVLARIFSYFFEPRMGTNRRSR